jgi:hypothetical protein
VTEVDRNHVRLRRGVAGERPEQLQKLVHGDTFGTDRGDADQTVRNRLAQISQDPGISCRIGRPAAVVRSGVDVADRRAFIRAAPGLGGKLTRRVWHRLVLGTIPAAVERGLDHHGAAHNHRDMLLLHPQQVFVSTPCRWDAKCAIITNVGS